MKTIAEVRETGATKVVIPIAGHQALWGLAFHLYPDTDEVRCEKCGRMVQWPEQAREHGLYHDALSRMPRAGLWEHLRSWWAER